MGVCIEVPNLCLITEFMQMGSVREILDNHSVDLKWRTKIIMVSTIYITKSQLLSAVVGCLFVHTVEPPRSVFLRSGHLPRPDMIFYEIFTNITYTSIGENIQHNKKQKKLTIRAGMILVHMSGQCPDLRE